MRVSWCGPTSESFPLKSADFSAFIIELHYNDTESRMTTSHTIRQRRKDSDEREKLLLNGSERSTVVVKTLAEIQGRLSIFQSSYNVKTFSAWNPLSNCNMLRELRLHIVVDRIQISHKKKFRLSQRKRQRSFSHICISSRAIRKFRQREKFDNFDTLPNFVLTIILPCSSHPCSSF